MKKILLNTGKQAVKNVIEPLYIESSFVQVYSGTNDILYKINSVCSIHLLHWVIEKMNKYNTFTLTRADKKNFIFDNKGKYSISGVNKALAILKKSGLINSTNEWMQGKNGKMYKTRNSMYYVNPYYFWKNPSRKSREEMIKTLELDKR